MHIFSITLLVEQRWSQLISLCHSKGVEVYNYRFTIVDLNNIGYKDDPWVLASQVAQVLYVADPTKKTKHVVVSGKQNIIGVEGIEEEYNQYN